MSEQDSTPTDTQVSDTPTPKAKRTRSPKGTALRNAYMSSARPADAARTVGMDGKAFRNVARRLGIYVSRGSAWDAANKRKVWDALPAHYRDGSALKGKASSKA